MLRFKRILAAVVDFVIICAAAEAVALTASLGDADSPVGIIMYIILCLLFALFKDKAFGKASIGKKIFKLRIMENGNDTLSLMACIKRWLTYILIAVEVPIMAATGQRLGDRWAKTTVEQQPAEDRGRTEKKPGFSRMIKYIVLGAVFVVECGVLRLVDELRAYGLLEIDLTASVFPWMILIVGAFLLPVEMALLFLGRETNFDRYAKRLCRLFFWTLLGVFCVASVIEICSVFIG